MVAAAKPIEAKLAPATAAAKHSDPKVAVGAKPADPKTVVAATKPATVTDSKAVSAAPVSNVAGEVKVKEPTSVVGQVVKVKEETQTGKTADPKAAPATTVKPTDSNTPEKICKIEITEELMKEIQV